MTVIQMDGDASTPRIYFDPASGQLEMGGRSLMEDPKDFFRPIRQGLADFLSSAGEKAFAAEFYFEYLNTTSTKEVFRILQSLGQLSQVRLTWKWASGDEDMLSAGKRFARLAGVEMDFVEMSN